MHVLGVALEPARQALTAACTEVWWRGGSPVLFSGTDGVLPPVHHQPFDAPDVPRSPGGGGVATALADDPATRAWAERQRMPLLIPDDSLVRRLGDKLCLDEIAAASAAHTPRSRILPPGPRPAGRLLDEFGGAVVVQRGPNNLTGAGTRLARTSDELDVAFAEWAAEPVKVSVFEAGTDLTVSGCVTAEGTVVSGISHQLVGIDPLTRGWGVHCGNQLLDGDDLPPGVSEDCRTTCARIGDTLGAHGFRGMFGIDAVLTSDGRVILIELNPRIQSVTSLLNYRERAAGMMPLPGVHLMTHLGLPMTRTDAELTANGLAQIVVTAPQAGVVRSSLPHGRYAWHGGALSSLAPDVTGPAPGAGEVLAWPYAQVGETVAAGSRLCVLLFGSRVAPVSPDRRLHPDVAELVGRLHAATTRPAATRREHA